MIYRGGVGMWSYYMHRGTGLGVLLFLFIHIIDTVLIGWGPDIYNKVMAIYKHPLFRVGEVGLFAAVLFHALNGIRIILIDFWEKAVAYQKEIFYAEMVLFAIGLGWGGYLMLKPLFGGA